MSRTQITETHVIAGLFEDLPIPLQATTSRTLVSNAAVRVVGFAMDSDQELTEHSAPRPVVVQILQGTLRFHVMGEDHNLAAGDVVYLAPSERHNLIATSPCRFVLIMDMSDGS